MKIDNTSKLADLCNFNPTKSYYKFVCLIRWKDFKFFPEDMVLKAKEKQEILVKQWLIDSQEMLDEILPDMIRLTELVKGRLYMCVDRKSTLKTIVQMRKQCDDYIEPFIYSDNASCSVIAINKIPASASSLAESSDKEEKRWLFDVDNPNDMFLMQRLDIALEKDILAKLPTPNGYHYITKKNFDAHKIVNELRDIYNQGGVEFPLDLKDNAMTLIYWEI